jgi:hypothetical protein
MGTYELKQSQKVIFSYKSIIWWFDFVLVGRVEGPRDLPVGQDLGGHLGVRNFQPDHIYDHFLRNQ